MPIYEYRCLKCGHEIEVVQKFSDPPLRRCKECKGKVEKLISRSAFHLKGGGWYAQGYGGGSGKKGKPASSGSQDGGKSGGSGSDSGGGSTKKEAAGA